MNKFQARHGDLLIEEVDALPEGLTKKNTRVLLDGEVTGHAHRLDVDDKKAEIYEAADGTLYIHVIKPAPLVHEEHDTIVIPIGTHKMTRQREWNPYEEAIRYVQD